jgi:hypothetical protein
VVYVIDQESVGRNLKHVSSHSNGRCSRPSYSSWHELDRFLVLGRAGSQVKTAEISHY